MSFALIMVIVILLVLLVVGAPVVLAIGTAAMSYFIIKPDMIGSLMIYAHRLFSGMDSFIYICIPVSYTHLLPKAIDMIANKEI